MICHRIRARRQLIDVRASTPGREEEFCDLPPCYVAGLLLLASL